MPSSLSLLLVSVSVLLGGITNALTDLPPPPSRYGFVLFPAFQALDVFGPLDILNTLSLEKTLNLSIIAPTLDPVSTQHSMPDMHAPSNFSEAIVPTHTFDNPPDDLEVLIVPGGMGTRSTTPTMDAVVSYIREVYPSLRYLISVCTGAGLVAQSGVLDGRRATGNKKAWAWVTAQSDKVHWVPVARWVQDGNIWTTSGVAAGMDGTFDFISTVYGEDVASRLANSLEYERHLNASWDPFAALYNLTVA